MTGILHPNAEKFEELIKNEGVVLVDFWAGWCGPCKMLAPVIDQISKKYDGKLTVIKIDIDEYPELADKYSIQSIPTVLILKNGGEVEREIGLRTLENYTEILGKFIKD